MMTTNPLVPVPAAEPLAAAHVRRARPPNAEIAAWILIGALILYVMYAQIVAALVGGLALYLILEKIADIFARKMPHAAARPLALIFVTLVGGGIIFGAIALGIVYLRRHASSVPALMTEMANILQSTRAYLGGYGQQLIPEVMTDAETIKGAIANWLKEHAATVRLAGSNVSVGFVHLVMGMLLATLVFFRHVAHHDESARGPLSAQLQDKVDRLSHAFSRIAAAQIKVSLFNTAIIAMYLLTLFAFGKVIPFSTTLIIITFICGLLPILGNLVSNIVLVILSLGISGSVALTSLIFVVALSKLQYVLTSRLVGREIDSQSWEILLAILLGEATFGISGVIMAPIVYAFVKRELRERGLV